MSLITCCPACGTMFRVVADQLKISEGWVRCGHCAHVFDATAHMVETARPAALMPVPPVEEPFDEPPPAVAATPAPPADEPLESEPAVSSELPMESPLDQPFVFRRSDLAQDEEAPSEPMASSPLLAAAEPPRDGAYESSLDDAALPHDEVGFVRQARRRAFWRRPLVRAFMVLLLLALGVLLALQVAVHDRDRLAATQPQLRPWLLQLCAALQCTIAPPRQIEAIAIDSSTFNKLRSDTYRLSFTLKNGARLPVATPSMELTLTDTQDQPVLRRVLSPAELGAQSPVIPAGGEWAGSVSLAVAANGSTGRIAGYRLLAFYP